MKNEYSVIILRKSMETYDKVGILNQRKIWVYVEHIFLHSLQIVVTWDDWFGISRLEWECIRFYQVHLHHLRCMWTDYRFYLMRIFIMRESLEVALLWLVHVVIGALRLLDGGWTQLLWCHVQCEWWLLSLLRLWGIVVALDSTQGCALL